MAMPPPPSRAASEPRTLKELQNAFDLISGHLYALYDYQTWKTGQQGAGKIVIRFTIGTEGTITDCAVVSDGFGDPIFSGQVLALVERMNFGPGPEFSYPNYPIRFKPLY